MISFSNDFTYNIQIGVDSEYVVWISSGPQPTDTTILILFLKSLEERTKRFLSRGNQNVLSECILVALAHNISKLHNKIMNNKCDMYLHPIKMVY